MTCGIWLSAEWRDTLQAAIWMEPTSEPIRDSIIQTLYMGIGYLETVSADLEDGGKLVPSANIHQCAVNIEMALRRYDR